MRSMPRIAGTSSLKTSVRHCVCTDLGLHLHRYYSKMRPNGSGFEVTFDHGLARSFSGSAASAALAACHREIFYHFTLSPLEMFVTQIERFVRSSAHDLNKTVTAWETLEAYRVAIPSACDQLTAALFRSNVKVAIALLKSRQSNRSEKARSA